MTRALPPATASRLAKLGIRSRHDFLYHLPLRYEDETRLTAPEAAQPGAPVLVQAPVRRAEIAFRPKRQLVVHADGLVLRFLNFYGSQVKQFERAVREGSLVRAYGEVRPGWIGAEIVHPRYRIVAPGEPLADTLTPVYPTTAGLSQALLRKLVFEALAEEAIEEILPSALRERLGLAPLEASVRLLHRPAPGADTAAAWRRVKFDELLAQQLQLRLARRKRRERTAPALPAGGALLKRFLGRLPFRLTRAQQRVMAELLRDLGQPHPMQRLLQGDVGSGKTIVAAIGCLAAVDAGGQAAVMAPTEILAEQHFRKFSAWLGPLGVSIAWLHGGLPAAERKSARRAIASGAASIAIGTQALFQEGVEFARLALAIVDEQHRFGVKQRLQLRRKSEQASAHQLMMSATPIPRTLSMSYFADLDVSVIDELPPGRKPVTTRLASAARRGEVLERIRAACADGQQAYWVCPVIEESKDRDLQAALDAYEELRRELPRLRIGLVHGRMAPADKASAMRAFAEGATQLLVCTTVIEVGVDVPNASLMVIEHAERFGLAQLHQLRGRIGRGTRASDCILLFQEPLSEGARARLKVIYENADGFAIAEQDLALRGPGELLGVAQSGAPLLRFADLVADEPLLEAARAAADELLDADEALARRHIDRWLGVRADFGKV
ncbi:MAG: ATP-dependent DNA helicase RecG [Betaproteobacteria bacterium]|nr:ATP-dependent DNA helicase RecG [Betaproteobacteria bacterium]